MNDRLNIPAAMTKRETLNKNPSLRLRQMIVAEFGVGLFCSLAAACGVAYFAPDLNAASDFTISEGMVFYVVGPLLVAAFGLIGLLGVHWWNSSKRHAARTYETVLVVLTRCPNEVSLPGTARTPIRPVVKTKPNPPQQLPAFAHCCSSRF